MKKSLKIVFLDIDGVFNCQTLRSEYGMTLIAASKIQLLERIVRETGAVVILISTWRLDLESLSTVIRRLAWHGVSLFDVADVDISDQLHALRAWFATNKNTVDVQSYVIIDDWNLFREFAPNHYLTDDLYGLTDSMASAIIDHLNTGE